MRRLEKENEEIKPVSEGRDKALNKYDNQIKRLPSLAPQGHIGDIPERTGTENSPIA